MDKLKKYKEQIFLFSILLVAFALRCYHVTFQSLWVDELHTMIESDPDQTWGNFFDYLKHYDSQPPLHYSVEKILFELFGHTEFVARFLSVIAGTFSVWAIFCLGKEIYGKGLGFIVAILTTVNYFNIYYSQEARNYILVFLFTTLSFLFFIRLIKNLQKKHALYYTISTILMLYSHYFGILVFISQVIIGCVFYFGETDKKRFLKLFLSSAFVVCLIFSVWLPYMLNLFQIESFWIPPISPVFVADFFYEYFGNTGVLNSFLLLLLILYFSLSFSLHKDKQDGIKDPIVLSFIVFSIWIFTVYFIPYVRSLLVVPMLIPKYTIVVLPAILLMLSFGIELIRNQYIKYVVLSLFVILSLMDLVVKKEYYSKPTKTQFREIAQFIATAKNPYPLITSENTGWHQKYYMKKFNPETRILVYPDTNYLSSRIGHEIVKDGFWLTGAHKEKKLPNEFTQKYFSSFDLLKEADFVDAWCQLYVSKDTTKGAVFRIDPTDFDPTATFSNEGKSVAAIWSDSIASRPIELPKGKYTMTITSKGTPLAEIYPHLNVFVNNEKIGDYFTTNSYIRSNEFHFELKNDQKTLMKIIMDNDSSAIANREDRNAFILSIEMRKLKE